MKFSSADTVGHTVRGVISARLTPDITRELATGSEVLKLCCCCCATIGKKKGDINDGGNKRVVALLKASYSGSLPFSSRERRAARRWADAAAEQEANDAMQARFHARCFSAFRGNRGDAPLHIREPRLFDTLRRLRVSLVR